MGRAQGHDAVRYVSPVTARLFSKAGHSEALGLSAGEVLAPIEADWRHRQQSSGQAPTVGGGAVAEGHQSAGSSFAGGMAVQQRHVEVVRPSAASPVPSVDGVTSPQAYLEFILRERVRVCAIVFMFCFFAAVESGRVPGPSHKGKGVVRVVHGSACGDLDPAGAYGRHACHEKCWSFCGAVIRPPSHPTRLCLAPNASATLADSICASSFPLLLPPWQTTSKCR